MVKCGSKTIFVSPTVHPIIDLVFEEIDDVKSIATGDLKTARVYINLKERI